MALPGYSVESCVIQDPAEIEQEWLELQNRADCSYFQSWGWIGTWLKNIVIDHNPRAVKVWFGNTLVGMGVFVNKRSSRNLVIRSDAFFLNEYPFDGCNMVIEYNGLLSDPSHCVNVYQQVIAHLFKENRKSNELFFSAVQPTSPLIHVAYAMKGITVRVLDESSAWSINLDDFTQDADAFLATLSKNRRVQIRRSIRLYESNGPLQIAEASNPEEAQVFFDGLKELHTARWASKGLGGSFANPQWEAFHRELIRSRYAKGEIQLLKVHISNRSIGYLYNLVWRKHIYVLQTGFRMSDDRRLMPGYVAHVMAIEYNKIKRMKVYDLMHGYSLYKTILCNHQRTLQWLVVQKKKLPFILEGIARSVYRNCRRL